MSGHPPSPLQCGYDGTPHAEDSSDEESPLLTHQNGCSDTGRVDSEAFHESTDGNDSVEPPMTKKEAWLQSATGSAKDFLLFNFYSFLFIASNIEVNTYSTSANIDLETGSFGDIMRQLRYPLLILFGLSTFIANYVSKVNRVVRPHRALKLDPAPSGRLPRLLHALKRLFLHGNEEQIYLNANRALLSAKIFDDYDILLYINQASLQGVDPVRLKSIQDLLASECGVRIADNLNSLFVAGNGIESRKVVLVSCGLNKDKRATVFVPPHCRLKHIVFYPHNWLERIYRHLVKAELISALQTAGMSLLAFTNWMISKGVPGLVVLLTVFMASYKNEAAILQSQASREMMLFVNMAQAWLGKMLINNILKGEEAYIELRKSAMRVTHLVWPQWHFNNYVGVFITGLVFFSMVFPNAVVTPEFYASEGPTIALQEINACLLQPLLQITASIPSMAMRVFVYASIWTNVWMNIPTGWMACYKKGGALVSRLAQKMTSRFGWSDVNSTQEKQSKPLSLFSLTVYIAIIIDSFVTGYNTRFSTVKTIDHVLHDQGDQEPMVAKFGELITTYPVLQQVSPLAFGFGTFAFALFWSLQTVEGYVDNYHELMPRAYKLLPKSVRNGVQSCAETGSALKQSMVALLTCSCFKSRIGQSPSGSSLQEVRTAPSSPV